MLNLTELAVAGALAACVMGLTAAPAFAADSVSMSDEASPSAPSPYWHSDPNGSYGSTTPTTGVQPRFGSSGGAAYCNGNVSIPKKSGNTLRATSSQTCSSGVLQSLKGQILGLDYYGKVQDFGPLSSTSGIGGTTSLIMTDTCGSSFKYEAKVNVRNNYPNGASTNDDYYGNTVAGVCS